MVFFIGKNNNLLENLIKVHQDRGEEEGNSTEVELKGKALPPKGMTPKHLKAYKCPDYNIKAQNLLKIYTWVLRGFRHCEVFDSLAP